MTPPHIEAATDIRAVPGGWLATGTEVVVAHGRTDGAFLRHGWQSWSMVGWERLADPPLRILVPGLHRQADDPATENEPGHVGSWVGAVSSDDGEGLLVGALGLDARVYADGSTVRGVAAGPVDWFIATGDVDVALEGYARLLGERLGARTPPPQTVWCTWYSQGRTLDAHRLDVLVDDVAGLPVGLFLVDDGWERSIGDWRPHDGFPEGMAAVADRIRVAGMRPGLWLAPLAVEAAEAADWDGMLVVDDDGAPVLAGHNWDSTYFGVDVTHPEALARVVASVTDAVDWGFTHLKLDFLFAGAIPGRRHRDGPPEAAYRAGVEAIRAAVGDDVHLAACGAPIVPSVGVFDSIRVGPDVAPYWESPLYRHVLDYSAPGMRRAIATTLHRLWLAPVIGVDPDVAFVRSRDNLLTESQMRLHRDLCHITGMPATSDPPGWLSEEELARLVMFLDARPTIERLDRYRFRLDDREVDYGDVVEGAFEGM